MIAARFLGIVGLVPMAVGVFTLVSLGACAQSTRDRGFNGQEPARPGAAAVLEGTLEVLIEDSDRGSHTIYFLIADRRVPLQLTSPPPNLTTGTRVRVRGQWQQDGALAVAALEIVSK